jgi:hypothetical protein
MDAKSTLLSLESLQVEGFLFTPRTNLERYGFAYVLKERLRKWYLPRSFCEWIHGWYWWQNNLEVQDLIYDQSTLPSSQWLLVSNDVERSIAISGGISNVATAGLPIIYAVPKVLPQRRENTLLAFLEHSAENEKDYGVADATFLDYLSDIRKDFEIVAVSIFSLDYTEKLVREIAHRGLVPIRGANPTDTRSLQRTCNYLSFFSDVTGNSMGSYVAYSMYLGANVFLPGHFYKRDYSIYKNSKSKFSDHHISRIEYHFSETYARRNYPFLFLKENNLTHQERICLGKKYVGEKFLLSNRDIEFYLGWRWSTQVKELISGAARRIDRRLNRSATYSTQP